MLVGKYLGARDSYRCEPMSTDVLCSATGNKLTYYRFQPVTLHDVEFERPSSARERQYADCALLSWMQSGCNPYCASWGYFQRDVSGWKGKAPNWPKRDKFPFHAPVTLTKKDTRGEYMGNRYRRVGIARGTVTVERELLLVASCSNYTAQSVLSGRYDPASSGGYNHTEVPLFLAAIAEIQNRRITGSCPGPLLLPGMHFDAWSCCLVLKYQYDPHQNKLTVTRGSMGEWQAQQAGPVQLSTSSQQATTAAHHHHRPRLITLEQDF
jgi:hypothetical protein